MQPHPTRPPLRASAARARTLLRVPLRAAIAAPAAIAVVVTPIALAASTSSQRHQPAARAAGIEAGGGYPIRGAIHNPPSSAYYRTTGIFSNNASWTNRVENLGTGGAAIDACHAPAGNVACLQAFNLTGGLAFSFISEGSTGGEILLHNTNGAPFTTNAHGVATGLNANYLQGRQASEFQLASQPAANANELGGQPASSYLTTGQLLFADVLPGPRLQEGSRGATAVTRSGSSYTVTFGTSDISRCSFTASPTGEALASGQLAVQASVNTSQVIVNAPSGFSAGFDLQVLC